MTLTLETWQLFLALPARCPPSALLQPPARSPLFRLSPLVVYSKKIQTGSVISGHFRKKSKKHTHIGHFRKKSRPDRSFLYQVLIIFLTSPKLFSYTFCTVCLDWFFYSSKVICRHKTLKTQLFKFKGMTSTFVIVLKYRLLSAKIEDQCTRKQRQVREW